MSRNSIQASTHLEEIYHYFRIIRLFRANRNFSEARSIHIHFQHFSVSLDNFYIIIGSLVSVKSLIQADYGISAVNVLLEYQARKIVRFLIVMINQLIIRTLMIQTLLIVNQIVSLNSQHIRFLLSHLVILQIDVLNIIFNSLCLLQAPSVALSGITYRLKFRTIGIIVHIHFLYGNRGLAIKYQLSLLLQLSVRKSQEAIISAYGN